MTNVDKLAQDAANQRQVSGNYLGPHALFSDEELALIRSQIPLGDDRWKSIKQKIDHALDNEHMAKFKLPLEES